MRIKLGMIAVVILAGLSVAAQQNTEQKPISEVKTNYDKDFDYSKIKTFYVAIGTSWDNPANEDYAKAAVANELTAKGWTQATNVASADALVLIHGATSTRHTMQNFYAGGYGGYDWAAGPGAVVASKAVPLDVGTGVIDIFDIKTKKLLFRGMAEDELSPKGSDNQPKIKKAIKMIFKDFPPKSEG